MDVPADRHRVAHPFVGRAAVHPASVPTVGVLLGVQFLAAMINEFFIAAVLPSWRWLHVVMGVIFAFGAGWDFARPCNAFWTLSHALA